MDRRGNRHPHFGVNRRTHRGWLCTFYGREQDNWQKGQLMIVHYPSTDHREECWLLSRVVKHHEGSDNTLLCKARSLRALVVEALTMRLEGKL